MKRSIIRILAVALALAVLFGAAAPAIPQAEAATDGITVRINALKTKFPHGKFWNHYVSKASEAGLSKTHDESFSNSVTTHCCATHTANAAVGQYECNYFDGGIQCWGFACRFFYDVFGVRASKMSKRYDTENIKPGDYLRFGTDSDGHSAFCIARNGNTLTLVEGNYHPTASTSEHCMIYWNRKVDVSKVGYYKRASNYDEIKSSKAVYLLNVDVKVDGTNCASGHASTTFDVYINDKLSADNVKDYSNTLEANTRYEIKDIRLTGCYARADSKTYSGTIGADTTVAVAVVTSHTPVSVAAVPPTCTAAGKTAGRKCGVCGTTLQAQASVPALGHNYDETVIPATCAELRKVRCTCTRCGYTKTETDPALFVAWTETPAPKDAAEVQTRKQYRISTRTEQWTVTETGSVEYAQSWPAGFSKSSALYTKYNKTPVQAKETATEKIEVKTEAIGYIYWHWCRNYTGGPINRKISDEKTSTYTTFHAFYSTKDAAVTASAGARRYDNKAVCADTYWWQTNRVAICRCTYTKYTRSASGEWGEWSAWTDSALTQTDGTRVEERTLYRWVPAGTSLYGSHVWGAWTGQPYGKTIEHTCAVCKKTESRTVDLLGDTDLNGSVDAADARLALRIAVKLEASDDDRLAAADIDRDGVIAAGDARLILRKAVKLESF